MWQLLIFADHFVRREAKVSQRALDEYNEMIQDTVYDLNVRLQRVDEKLEGYPVPSFSNPNISLDDEREVHKMCIRICEDAKQFIESLNIESTVLQDRKYATGTGVQPGFEAQLLTRQALDKNRDNSISIIGHLQNHLQALLLDNISSDNEGRKRPLEDINACRQCLEVCKVASGASSQKVYKIGKVIADSNSDQVVANTLTDLFDVRKAISNDNSAQLLVSMTGEDLRFLAEKQ